MKKATAIKWEIRDAKIEKEMLLELISKTTDDTKFDKLTKRMKEVEQELKELQAQLKEVE